MATAQEIADTLAGLKGPVQYGYRFEKRDHLYVLQEDITPGVLSASIQLDNFRDVVRTARFTIDPSLITLDPTTDHVAVSMLLNVRTATGLEQESIAAGFFHLDVPRRRFTPNHEVWDVDASDLSVHLVEATTPGPYTVASGTNYVTAAETILDDLTLQHSIPVHTGNTPVDFSWGPGTTWAKIVNDLLLGINFYPISPGATGVFESRERIDPFTEVLGQTYDAGEMVTIPWVTSQDIQRWPNQVVVVIDDPNRSDIGFEMRVNNDVDSPISVRNRGVFVDHRIAGGRVFNTAHALEIVKFELQQFSTLAERAELLTFPDPRRKMHEFYKVNIPGVEVNTPWFVHGWDLELTPGATMRHNIGRIRDVNDIITQYPATVLNDGADHYWRMGESSGDLLDQVGSADLTPTSLQTQGAPGLLGDDPDGSAEFNGATSKAENTSPPSTLEDIWDGEGSFECIVDLDGDGEGDLGRLASKDKWEVWVDSSNRLTLMDTWSGTDGNWRETTGSISFNVKHHVSIRYNSDVAGAQPTFVIDGIVKTVGSGLTESVGPTTGTRTSDVGDNFVVGNNTAQSRTADGHLDEVAVYSTKALDDARAVDHFFKARL